MNERALIDFFEDLHAHPELGLEEARTTERLRAALSELDIETLETGLPTGAVAVIRGGKPGRVIGLRADIDALPIQEETGLSYASQTPGRMHACGHDFHTAVMLGAAALLKARQADLAGTVKVVFQPAEEICRGGDAVVASGAVDDAEEFYAVHSYPPFPAGKLGIKPGPVMAAPDRFRIDVRGVGAHAGQPHKGVDPIPVAASIALSAQTIVSRGFDPFAAAVVSVTRIEAGNTWNVVPETAVLEGTARAFTRADRDYIRARLEQVAQGAALAGGCAARLTWTAGTDPVINDADLCERAREVAGELGFEVGLQEDTMGGEDFSAFLRNRPGVFVRVGTGGGYPNHHPRFTVDERALWPAARFFAELAARRAGA